MVCLVGAGLVVILVVGAFLFWLYRLGVGEGEELEDPDILEPGSQELRGSGNQEVEGSRSQGTEESGTVDNSPLS
jgi:hypothetical protein